MNPSSLLDQLRDAHAPEAISWWPPAMGWWILSALILLVTLIALKFYFKFKRDTEWKRAALKEYSGLRKAYAKNPTIQGLSNIVILMKRSAASATGDRAPLSATGEHWIALLREPSYCLSESDIETLSKGHYQKNSSCLDKAALQRIQLWIEALDKSVKESQRGGSSNDNV